MSAQETIKVILDYLGMTPTEFGRGLGLERPQAIFDLQNGKTKLISKRMASKIKHAYPSFSETWLLTGCGEMLEQEIPRTVIEGKVPQVVSKENIKDAISVINRLSLQLDSKDATIRELAEANGLLAKQLEEKDARLQELTDASNRLTFAFEKLAEQFVVGGNGETYKKGIG